MKWIIPFLLTLCAIPANAAIRSSSCQSSVTGSVTVAWPSAVSGDLVVITGASAYNASLPSGWSDTPATGPTYFSQGSVWNGIAFWKVLNSTDISTGSVTVSIANTFDVAFCMVDIVGNPGAIREVDCVPATGADPCYGNPGVYAMVTPSTTSAVIKSDLLLLFAPSRGSGGVRTATFSTGTILKSADDGMNAFVVLGYACQASGITPETFNFGDATFYHNSPIIVIEGAGIGNPCPGIVRHRAQVY